MNYTLTKKDKIFYYELNLKNQNFFDTFLKIMENSIFKVEKIQENNFIVSGGKFTWIYENGKNIIITESAFEIIANFILDDFFNLYRQTQTDNETTNETKDVTEENYTPKMQDFMDQFSCFNIPQTLDAKSLKINTQDMFEFAKQMNAMRDYYEDEFEQSGKMDSEQKALKNYQEKIIQKALRDVLDITQEEFEKLSLSDTKKAQDFIDDALEIELLKYTDIFINHKLDDDIFTCIIKPLLEEETKNQIGFIQSKSFNNINSKEYFFNLIKAGAKVTFKQAQKSMIMQNFYYSLQAQLCEIYNQNNQNYKLEDEEINKFIESLPNYIIFNKINIALQISQVTQGKERINQLDDIECLYDEWQKEECIELFMLNYTYSPPKLLAYERIDANLNDEEIKNKEQELIRAKKFNFNAIKAYKIKKRNDFSKQILEELAPSQKHEYTINLNSIEEKYIKEILNLDENVNITNFHINTINSLFNKIIRKLCGNFLALDDVLEQSKIHDLIHNDFIEILMQKSVSKKTLKNINICVFEPIFSTKEYDFYCNLEDEQKQNFALKIDQNFFKTLLKCGVSITQKHLKKLQTLKEFYTLMHKLNLENFNQNLNYYENQIYYTKDHIKIQLKNLNKITNFQEFLNKNTNFIALNQILDILSQIKDLSSYEKEEFLQNYDFKDWQHTDGEIFVYDRQYINENSIGFLKANKEFQEPKIRLLGFTQIKPNNSIESQAEEIFDYLMLGESLFDLDNILNFLNIIKHKEYCYALKANITYGLTYRRMINLKELANYLKTEEIKNIIFIQNDDECFNSLSKALKILNLKANFDFKLDLDNNLQIFILENEENKNLKSAIMFGDTTEEEYILDFIEKEQFNQNSLPLLFDLNFRQNGNGGIALNSIFYQGCCYLEDNYTKVDKYIGSFDFFQCNCFLKYFKNDLKKIIISYIDRSEEEDFNIDENIEFKSNFDKKFFDYVYSYKNSYNNLFICEKNNILYIMFCIDMYQSNLEDNFTCMSSFINKHFPLSVKEVKFYSRSPYEKFGLETFYIQEQIQLEKLQNIKQTNENFISLQSIKMAKEFYDTLKPFDGLNALKIYNEFKKICLTPVNFLENTDKDCVDFFIDIDISHNRPFIDEYYICFKFEKDFYTFFKDENLSRWVLTITFSLSYDEYLEQNKSYSSNDNNGEFIKYANLKEVDDMENLEINYEEQQIRCEKIFDFIETNPLFKKFFNKNNPRNFKLRFATYAEQIDEIVWINNTWIK
ncbi:TPA: hypothetical protein R1763_000711 [Campylobacter lari]|uniref:hypothetical protein n=1 Tax=Campylobacter sp. IFREMER_LSEM_CL1890 TaxID=2911615 RepID=UPI001417B566|nr:hypothetical protein [Campylobacter sp. IFREMER_LSEM_CL1890]EDP6879262.1 hypothetical protein [Campylobacter lari]MCV3408528.1 hypothetical protein [Campylobacter sp. IFREMER_LSEM_CL1890]HEC1797288.1 hypothetical protein [Campylobacter lari]